MSKRGSLILIEGLDRTGKSTQADLIVNEFENAGKKVELIKFPDRTTEIGKLINQFLVDKNFNLPKESIHLLFSANRWELKSQLLEKLLQGVNLIMDRYYYSGIAYSTANGLDFDWCKSPDIGLPKPDLVLFLTFKDNENVNKLKNRENYGEERYEITEFQQEVKKNFETFFNKEEKQRLQSSNSKADFEIVYVDNKTIEEVKTDVLGLVKKFIEVDNTNPVEYFQ